MVSLASAWDVVFEKVSLVDGTGAPARTADVAVAQGRIAAVEPALPPEAKAQAARRVAGQGRTLCPGFIDVHAHGELEPLADPRSAGKILSGVTTEISGNCGLAPFPLVGALRSRFEKEARDEFHWEAGRVDWTSAAEYFQRLEASPSTMNRGFLCGHNSLRAAVNGYADGPVRAENAARMEQELDRALAEGCFGLSTGLIYPPGCFAPPEEIAALARRCAARGALYTTHMRSEGDLLLESLQETMNVARATGVRVQVSHLKTSQRRNWTKLDQVHDLLTTAREKEHLEVHADRYPYVAGATGLDAVLPTWAYAGGTSEEMRRLQDAEVSAKLEAEIIGQHQDPDYWEKVLVTHAVDQALNPQVSGRTLAELARDWKLRPFEALQRILLADRCRTGAIFFSMCEENLERILRWDFVMIASDATARDVTGPTATPHPHPRTFGTFPRTLARYVRERQVLTLEEAIRRMTSLPAETFHLRGRGKIEPGAWADLVLLDPQRIEDRATFTAPNQFPEGLHAVYVNGQQVTEGPRILDVRPGQVLRHG